LRHGTVTQPARIAPLPPLFAAPIRRLAPRILAVRPVHPGNHARFFGLLPTPTYADAATLRQRHGDPTMNEDTGKLILRLTLGMLILLHGIQKLTGGVDWMDGMLVASGLPVFFKYGVYLGEIVAPVLVILGFHTRIGAWLIAVNMLFAIGLAHWNEVFAFTESGTLAIEKQYMFMFSAIALALIGPGRYAINRR